ncbi:IS1096 element passenger TnpR family protein [Robiginitalea sp. IMCC43444]|uniref:IS1096 element passenger TnpR family protein n=1 Tax=Robiginitalea sp. IMCC43444 TaxID=3459121 RepID=UPI0040412341
MIYKIRVILDAEEDIFRDLELEAGSNLEELHNAITQSFGFLGEEMASFYTCDENWVQDEEIPLFDLSEGDQDGHLMRAITLSDVMDEDSPKLLYVYDFLNMWTFFVELADITPKEDGRSYPNLLFSFGEVPESPPEKRFEADEGPELDEPFGSYDDLDFDENWN